MRNIVLALLLLVLLCTGCRPTGTPDGSAAMQPVPNRTESNYYFNCDPESSLKQLFNLSEPEIQRLRELASRGDGTAGTRLHMYYTISNPNPELADEAIEMVPRGDGTYDYNILTFYYGSPDDELAGSITFSGASQHFLQKKQVITLTSLAVAGERQAARRLSEYYIFSVPNKKLATVFHKFAEGDNSALPEIEALDAAFKGGDLELVRKQFPFPAREKLDLLWPF